VWIGAGPGESEQRLSAPSVNSDFPAWSPDGRLVAYQTSRGWRSTLAVQQVSDGLIRTFDLDADHVWVNDWSPDGTHVVVASMRRGRWSVDVVEVSTGRWRSIVPTGAGGEYVRWPTWSPTGDRIVYERGFWTGNVWIADLD
jgi:TolB protein